MLRDSLRSSVKELFMGVFGDNPITTPTKVLDGFFAVELFPVGKRVSLPY